MKCGIPIIGGKSVIWGIQYEPLSNSTGIQNVICNLSKMRQICRGQSGAEKKEWLQRQTIRVKITLVTR